jgi:transcriptional regulator
MLVHPWDAPVDAAEWQNWLTSTDRFGLLAVNNVDGAQAPIVLPTHFTLAGGELLIHLARPNPAWPHLEDGVPTSYYSAVQFVCRPTVVHDPDGKADLLAAQLADFQPEGGHAEVAVDERPYGRMLAGIRGVRLTVLRVEAKFKYDDHNPVEHRERVIGHLEERGRALDAGAAAQQGRRLSAIGDWRTHREEP